MPKRTFSRDQLRSILWGEEGEVILNKMTSQTRWETHYRLIFKPDDGDKLYETSYSKGSTEMQVTQPWAYEEEEVECAEVIPFEKVVTDYKPVEEFE